MALDVWKERFFQKYLAYNCRPARGRRHLKRLVAAPPYGSAPPDRRQIRVAALQVKMELYRNPLRYVEEMHRRTGEAARAGAQLVVFPEYNNLQLLGMLPGVEKFEKAGTDPKPYGALQDLPVSLTDLIGYLNPAVEPLIRTTFSTLAAAYGLYLAAGSFLLIDKGKVVNRALLYDPRGNLAGCQDKVHLMPQEGAWGLSRGERFNVYRTAIGSLALPVCMDATYFETFRILEHLGAEVALLPIANSEPYNFWLALRGIWPRVQESPIYGVKSALVGELAGYIFTGRAGIYAPLELVPQLDGVLAEVESPDREGMAVADLDLEALHNLRSNHPWRDTNHELYRNYFPAVYDRYE